MNTATETGNAPVPRTRNVDELGQTCAWCGQSVPMPCADDQYERCDNYRLFPVEDERRH